MADNKSVLVLDIWQDIKRHMFSYLLMLLVVISAFAVIYFTHMNRQTTSDLENLLTERDELDIEWRNLLLEQNSLAEHSEIEKKAQRELRMQRPESGSEIILKIK
ncbi:cell division protein FtsL [Thalassotalea agarivorans]|uniref:Cell division protein FtsL n=1 Tax=Thalassotalea agarivorans TaxID=349064 RepID=A0A1I0B0F7_THASX|nr:cell division protein FtsL [Thalassotalea agarivorans]SET00128.1 cell division protein FtsL [Thalassotalea agarivorans]